MALVYPEKGVFSVTVSHIPSKNAKMPGTGRKNRSGQEIAF